MQLFWPFGPLSTLCTTPYAEGALVSGRRKSLHCRVQPWHSVSSTALCIALCTDVPHCVGSGTCAASCSHWVPFSVITLCTTSCTGWGLVPAMCTDGDPHCLVQMPWSCLLLNSPCIVLCTGSPALCTGPCTEGFCSCLMQGWEPALPHAAAAVPSVPGSSMH